MVGIWEFSYIDPILKESYWSLKPYRSKVTLFNGFFDMVSLVVKNILGIKQY